MRMINKNGDWMLTEEKDAVVYKKKKIEKALKFLNFKKGESDLFWKALAKQVGIKDFGKDDEADWTKISSALNNVGIAGGKVMKMLVVLRSI